MKFIYTDHAEEKLQRKDIKGFGINKKLLESAFITPNYPIGKTSTGEFAGVVNLKGIYILRGIYDNIGSDTKIITFHVAKKGRYGN